MLREAICENDMLLFGHCPKGWGEGSDLNTNVLKKFFCLLEFEIFQRLGEGGGGDSYLNFLRNLSLPEFVHFPMRGGDDPNLKF